MNRVICEILVEQRMDAYADIFTSAIGNEIGQRSATAPTLQSITDNLLVNWRSAAYVAGMPPQFVLGPKQTLESFAENPVSDTQLLMLTGALIARLKDKAADLVSDPALTRRLHQALVEIGADFREARQKTKMAYPLEDSWNEFLELPAFHFYVWSSERLSFQAVYNAYEDFLVECVRVANGLHRCRTTGRINGKTFKDWCVAAFGNQVCVDCWEEAAINRLRLIRHSLSHASGRITPDMQAKQIQVRTHNGAIQIFPDDVRDAIRTLAHCALTLIDAASPLPQFK